MQPVIEIGVICDSNYGNYCRLVLSSWKECGVNVDVKGFGILKFTNVVYSFTTAYMPVGFTHLISLFVFVFGMVWQFQILQCIPLGFYIYISAPMIEFVNQIHNPNKTMTSTSAKYFCIRLRFQTWEKLTSQEGTKLLPNGKETAKRKVSTTQSYANPGCPVHSSGNLIYV